MSTEALATHERGAEASKRGLSCWHLHLGLQPPELRGKSLCDLCDQTVSCGSLS